MDTFPARLHVLLARDADTAVVIRRGPAKSVATIGWDRKTDTFTLGQWLRGRIYELRSDLSPDGKHLIYFAMNGKWHTEGRGSWSAISKAPYLKAVGFWPKGDCWNGGGLFLSPDEYWLNAGYCSEARDVPSDLKQCETYPFDTYFGGECTGVYYHRLARDGWEMVACGEHRRLGPAGWVWTSFNPRALPRDVYAVFEKRLPEGWVLRKLAYATCRRQSGRGCYFDEHELEHAERDTIVDCSAWEWADVAGDRLLWAEQGKLFSGHLGDTGVTDSTTLYDFNPMKFEAIAAPY